MACPQCAHPAIDHDPAKCSGHVDACIGCGTSDYQRIGEPCTECGGRVAPRPCAAWPMRGGKVCSAHGGRAPQVRAAAALQLAERQARASLADVVVEPIGSYVDELEANTAKAKAWMGHVGSMVADLSLESYRFKSNEGAEQLDARVKLFTDALAQLHRMLVDGAKLNLDERRVRLDEVRIGRVGVLLEAWAKANGIDVRAPRQLELIDRLLPILDGAPPPAIEVEPVDEPKGGDADA